MQQYASGLLTGSALVWWEATCTNDPAASATWTFEHDLVPALTLAYQDLGYEQRILTKFATWAGLSTETNDQYTSRFRRVCTELA